MLTEKQKQAVQMIFDGMKIQDIAAALGVHRCTIWRWRRKKEFDREGKRLMREYIREWRKQSGYYERRKEHRRRLRQIEKQLDIVAGSVRNGHTGALDAVWKEYRSCLFESEFGPSRRAGRG